MTADAQPGRAPVALWAWALAGFLAGDVGRAARAAEWAPIEPSVCRVDQAEFPELGPSARRLRRLNDVGAVRAVLASRAFWWHDPRSGPFAWDSVRGIGAVTAARLESVERPDS